MHHSLTHFTTVLLLLFLGGTSVALGEDKPALKDLDKIQPPGGVPLDFGRPGTPIKVDGVKKATKRLESAPQEELDKWVVELERITDTKLDGELEKQGCATYFVSRVSVAFENLTWNTKAANKLYFRAHSMPSFEAKVWKDAFETVLKKEIERPYVVPLVLIPVDALYDGQKYSSERGKKYLARLKQLTADDVSLWTDKADNFGGTELDAAVNIILLDEFFDHEKFQRGKFKATIGAR